MELRQNLLSPGSDYLSFLEVGVVSFMVRID